MSDISANNRIAKNSVFMSIRMVIVLLISLYTTRVILNVLGVEDYGVYNIVAGFVTMFSFLNEAMSSTVLRYFNYELGSKGTDGAAVVFKAAVVIHIILAIIIVFITEPVGLWYLHNKMVLPEGRMIAAEWIFHFSLLSLFVNVLTAPFIAAVMAHERMDFYAFIGILDAVIKLIMVVILPFIAFDKLIIYGLFFFLVSCIDFTIYVWYCIHNFSEINLKSNVSPSLYKEMLSYSGWSVLGSISYILREQGVNLVLNSFFGTIVNAAKGVANQVNGALQGFTSSLVTPSRPQVIQSYSQGNLERTWRLTYSISKLAFLVFLMMSLPICLEINYILHLWLGETVPPHTSTFIIIMLVTNTYGTFVSPISTVMNATGKIRFFQIISSFSNLMSVPLAYLFLTMDAVPEYVFIALLITMFTNLLAGLISAHKFAKLSFLDYFKSVFLPCTIVALVSTPLGYIPHTLLPEGFVRLIVECIYYVIVVASIAYMFALDTGEKNMIKTLLLRIIEH